MQRSRRSGVRAILIRPSRRPADAGRSTPAGVCSTLPCQTMSAPQLHFYHQQVAAPRLPARPRSARSPHATIPPPAPVTVQPYPRPLPGGFSRLAGGAALPSAVSPLPLANSALLLHLVMGSHARQVHLRHPAREQKPCVPELGRGDGKVPAGSGSWWRGIACGCVRFLDALAVARCAGFGESSTDLVRWFARERSRWLGRGRTIACSGARTAEFV